MRISEFLAEHQDNQFTATFTADNYGFRTFRGLSNFLVDRVALVAFPPGSTPMWPALGKHPQYILRLVPTKRSIASEGFELVTSHAFVVDCERRWPDQNESEFDEAFFQQARERARKRLSLPKSEPVQQLPSAMFEFACFFQKACPGAPDQALRLHEPFSDNGHGVTASATVRVTEPAIA